MTQDTYQRTVDTVNRGHTMTLTGDAYKHEHLRPENYMFIDVIGENCGHTTKSVHTDND